MTSPVPSSQGLPDLSDVSPRTARLLLRVRERASEIISENCPNPGDPKPQVSPMSTIHIEALAHIVALQRLHQHGAAYHEKRNNKAQAYLWERDATVLEELGSRLFLIDIN